MAAVEVHDCTADRWDDVVAVFQGPGDPGRCWCQWFYRGARADRASADGNRTALQAQVGERPPGVLGYLDGVPSGWCAVAPRPGYTRLVRSRLLAGALDLARRGGARVVEGYPVDAARRATSSAALFPGPAARLPACRVHRGGPPSAGPAGGPRHPSARRGCASRPGHGRLLTWIPSAGWGCPASRV